MCSAGQYLTLTDCLVSSLGLIGANFNDLMKQRTININISIATTRCCLLPPRVLSEVCRLFSIWVMGLLVLLLVLCSYKRMFYAQCEYKKWKLNPLSRDIHLHIPRLQCQTFEIVVLSVGTLL